MSAAELDKLADTLTKRLKASSEQFRTMVADYEPHLFSMDVEDIKKEVRDQLKQKYKGEKYQLLVAGTEQQPGIEAILKEKVPELVEYFYNRFRKDTFNSRTYRVAESFGDETNFTFILANRSGSRGAVFRYVRKVKQKAQKPLILAIDDLILSINRSITSKKNKLERTAKGRGKKRRVTDPLTDIGHAEESTVAMARSIAAQQIFLDFFKTSPDAAAKEFIKQIVGEEFFITVENFPQLKSDGSITYTYSAALQSIFGNRSRALQDAVQAGNLQKILTAILAERGTGWAEIPGSDSVLTAVKKSALNQFADISGKRTKNNIKKQKIKTKKAKGKSDSQKPKRKVVTVKGVSTAATVGGKRATGTPEKAQKTRGASIPSVPQLIGAINQKLPDVVARNMEPPRLQKQTGRLASSARITDIVTTRKGFPSIGYTYQKNPYQTFELGQNQGSPDYDPRKLIDASIREIAAQLAIGRFFTRRV